MGPSRATDVVELWATPVPPSSWIRVGLAPGSVGWPMNPVYVLDVGFALPLMALARVQLLTGRSNGGRLAVVLLVFTPQLGLGILALGRFGSPSSRRIVASTTSSEIVWSRCPRMSATRPTSPATSSTDPAGPAAPTPPDPMSSPLTTDDSGAVGPIRSTNPKPRPTSRRVPAFRRSSRNVPARQGPQRRLRPPRHVRRRATPGFHQSHVLGLPRRGPALRRQAAGSSVANVTPAPVQRGRRIRRYAGPAGAAPHGGAAGRSGRPTYCRPTGIRVPPGPFGRVLVCPQPIDRHLARRRALRILAADCVDLRPAQEC